MTQLALPVGLSDQAALDNFVAGRNAAALAAVQLQAERCRHPVIWLWGPAASGKSHLLLGAAGVAGDDARYCTADPGADPVAACEGRRLVCVDDIDGIAGHLAWETALFALFNRLADTGGALIVSASMAPRQVAFQLADLASRMASGPVFQLQPLTDEERIAALQLRADQRGLTLPTDVGVYLLRHFRRDMATLYGLLDRLDEASLAAQRKLTVPFVRQVLSAD